MLNKVTRHIRFRSVLLGCTSAVAALSLGAFAKGEVPDTPPDRFDEVIVTGTRDPHATASASLSPIAVLGGDQLAQSGEVDLRDALVQLSPSITRQSESGTNANGVDKINLRALSSNQTLILINGKRRHTTANISDEGGPEAGTTPVDVGLIPSSAIDHIEVLLDGASAQYGSDAMAGVINIILKDKDHGGEASTSNGEYFGGGGFTSGSTANWGMKLGNEGFLNVSAEYRHQDHTDDGRPDNRVGWQANHFFGNPMEDRTTLLYNAGFDLSDAVQAYSFSSYARRDANWFANYRVPSLLPQVFPNGFSPHIWGREEDMSFTGGLRGSISDWDWDVSATYGQDFTHFGVKNTVNVLLFQDTGYTPTTVHTMGFGDAQATYDAGVRRSFNVGLAEPVNFAFGGQYRRDWYSVDSGDPDAYYGAGTQGEQGLNPSSYTRATRTVEAGYVELSATPFTHFQVDVAGRYENYSDAGAAPTGKLSLREDFSPEVALRGTLSNGFRGPSMAETYYTSIATQPNGASGTLAVNSPAARLLGSQPLKPEKSTNYSTGLVLRPVERMNLTIDAYQIALRDRIVTGGSYNGQAAIDALALIGIKTNPGVDPNAVSAGYSTNGANTRTRGLDSTLSYYTPFDGFTVDWDAGVNFNQTVVQHVGTDLNGQPLLNAQGVAWLDSAFPRSKFIAGGHLTAGKFDLNLHEIRWGSTTTLLQYVTGPNAYSNSVFYTQHNLPRWQTNLEVGYMVTDWARLSVGATNLFDARPSEIPVNTAFAGVPRYDYQSQQIGMNGGFYYSSVRVTF